MYPLANNSISAAASKSPISMQFYLKQKKRSKEKLANRIHFESMGVVNKFDYMNRSQRQMTYAIDVMGWGGRWTESQAGAYGEWR